MNLFDSFLPMNQIFVGTVQLLHNFIQLGDKIVNFDLVVYLKMLIQAAVQPGCKLSQFEQMLNQSIEPAKSNI